MPAPIVVLSGPIGGGKTQLARALCDRFDGRRFSTHDLLVSRLGGDPDRTELQLRGRELDEATDGAWVADELAREIYDLADLELVVIDSARLSSQVDYLRRAFGRRILHVHVTASEEVCEARYHARAADRTDMSESSWHEAKADPTEQQVESLASEADVFVRTDSIGPDDVSVRVAARLGLLAKGYAQLVDVIVGGLYGSEGKGNIAYYLAPEYDLLVRVGGPNAGHTVYLPSGEKYVHHQLPSGTRASNASLLIGPGAVLNLEELLEEIAECEIEQDRLSIDPNAMIIEDADLKKERKLRKRIGSTARGIGAATARRIGRGDDVRLAKDVAELRPYRRAAEAVLEDAYRREQRVCLEGTQGTGLSLYHGPYPYVTSRDTTASGCLAEAGIPPARVRRVVMVVRTLPIRVGGTSGPLKYELSWEDAEQRAGFEKDELRAVEKTSTTKRQRRVGDFEWDLLRHSSMLNGPTDIALTFADYITRENEAARRFEQLTDDTIRFIEEVEAVASAPVSLISTRFAERSIIDRRAW